MQTDQQTPALSGVRSGGSVQHHLRDFANEWRSKGYTVLATRDYIRAAAHLGRWMDMRGLEIAQLTEEVFDEFVRHRCRCPGTSRHRCLRSAPYMARAQRFVDYLRRIGVAPSIRALPEKTVPKPLIGFRASMLRHRGVTEATIERYEGVIKTALVTLGDDPALYDAALVRRVVVNEARSRSRSHAKVIVTALRAFLRFLAAEGRCRPGLDHAVPTVPEWRLSALPRYLEADDVERVITSCDLNKPQGIRDRAVLLLLARLGLRAGDIVTMRLDDLDWGTGTLRVSGKGRKGTRLPLPQDAGDALLHYLKRVRPPAGTDRVFLCMNAPIRPFASSALVSGIVRFAIQRAGVTDPPSMGAHVLRHSAATAMLRGGASLDAVATVLRHQSSDMTAHYAKVDVGLLQQIAQPWPEGSSC